MFASHKIYSKSKYKIFVLAVCIMPYATMASDIQFPLDFTSDCETQADMVGTIIQAKLDGVPKEELFRIAYEGPRPSKGNARTRRAIQLLIDGLYRASDERLRKIGKQAIMEKTYESCKSKQPHHGQR